MAKGDGKLQTYRDVPEDPVKEGMKEYNQPETSDTDRGDDNYDEYNIHKSFPRPVNPDQSFYNNTDGSVRHNRNNYIP